MLLCSVLKRHIWPSLSTFQPLPCPSLHRNPRQEWHHLRHHRRQGHPCHSTHYLLESLQEVSQRELVLPTFSSAGQAIVRHSHQPCTASSIFALSCLTGLSFFSDTLSKCLVASRVDLLCLKLTHESVTYLEWLLLRLGPSLTDSSLSLVVSSA